MNPSRSNIAQVADHIMFVRPLLLIPVWTPALLGFWAGGGEIVFMKFIDVIILTSGLGVFVYGFNQLCDVAGDKLNRKNTMMALGLVSPAMAVFISISGALSSIIISVSNGIIPTILTFVGLVLGIAYSLPPLRFKDRPFHSLISNGLGHGALIFIIGWSIAGKWSWWAIPRAIVYAIAYSGVYCFTTVPDILGDRQVGKITCAVRWGAQKAMTIGLICIFIAGLIGFIVDEPALFITAIVSLPFYVLAIHNPEKCVRANQVAVLALSILACFYIPPYIILILTTIIFSALYYRKRLGIKYP